MSQMTEANRDLNGFGFNIERVWVEPLPYEQIVAEGTLGSAAYRVKLHHALVGNDPEERTITLSPHSTSSELFAAVLGGWLPASWASFRHRLILDRNAVSWLRENYDDGYPRTGRLPDLFDMVACGPFVRINHLLYAMEGNAKSWPTPDVIAQQLAEASSYLRKSLPGARLEPSDDIGMQAIEGILREWGVGVRHRGSILTRRSTAYPRPTRQGIGAGRKAQTTAQAGNRYRG